MNPFHHRPRPILSSRLNGMRPASFLKVPGPEQEAPGVQLLGDEEIVRGGSFLDGCWEVTSPSPPLQVCVCVCCVPSPALLLLPSRSSSLALSVGQGQIQGYQQWGAAGSGLLARAHPYLHSPRWQRARTIPQRWGTAISWDPRHVTRIFEITRDKENKERSFSNHFPEIFSFNFPPNHLAFNRSRQVR